MTGDDVTLVRHGQTEWSAAGFHTGRTDIPLTDLGVRQASALGEMLDEQRFSYVFSSPLTRAWRTMELAGLDASAESREELVEWDYGVYEGTRTIDVRKTIPGWSVWTDPIEGGESVDDVGARADRMIDELTAIDGPGLLFAHGHLLRILAARWMGLPSDHGRLLGLDTASVSTLGWERETRVIRRWNQECHLRSLDPTP